ncbi:unnamed protein product [Ambrosiozyma monospora]|uniref:Unnamed protein product n=1 Tax=Ambrosiozyma monospora TaxID=43982 RepID=A0ACB5TZN9_AMBMO|nr:unnamed protein product [Ambrosiozyma monospora]
MACVTIDYLESIWVANQQRFIVKTQEQRGTYSSTPIVKFIKVKLGQLTKSFTLYIMEQLGITPTPATATEATIEKRLQSPIVNGFRDNNTNTNNDVYLKLKKLEKKLELLMLQEDYIKDEQRYLKRELIRAQEEVKKIQSVPLVIGQFLEPIDQQTENC